MRLSATVLGSKEPNALAAFYQRLLGWTVVEDEPGWVRLRHPSGDLAPSGLSFAHEPDHVPPDWPGGAGDQQMQVHIDIDIDIDIAVDELAAGVAWAEACGAVAADHQPQPNVRVMLDPAGHPFCLFTGEV